MAGSTITRRCKERGMTKRSAGCPCRVAELVSARRLALEARAETSSATLHGHARRGVGETTGGTLGNACVLLRAHVSTRMLNVRVYTCAHDGEVTLGAD